MRCHPRAEYTAGICKGSMPPSLAIFAVDGGNTIEDVKRQAACGDIRASGLDMAIVTARMRPGETALGAAGTREDIVAKQSAS